MKVQLIQAQSLLRSGTPERVEEAIRLLQGTVYAFSMKVCGHREDAEDTMQDVLMRSLPHLAKLDDPRALAVWLYTAARNRCWRSRRKSAHGPSETLSLDDLTPDAGEIQRLLQEPAHSPEERAIGREQNKLLHQAVLSLPPQYRIVLVLHDMEELDTEQVAQILALQPGTVRVRLHRARLAVRKAMAKWLEGIEPPRARMGKRIRRTRRPADSSPGECKPECLDMFAVLSEYIDGALKPDSCEQMRARIEACPTCSAFLRDLRSAIDRCRQLDVGCEKEIPARLTALLAQEYVRLAATSS